MQMNQLFIELCDVKTTLTIFNGNEHATATQFNILLGRREKEIPAGNH